jgi:hypothetical protein
MYWIVNSFRYSLSPIPLKWNPTQNWSLVNDRSSYSRRPIDLDRTEGHLPGRGGVSVAMGFYV